MERFSLAFMMFFTVVFLLATRGCFHVHFGQKLPSKRSSSCTSNRFGDPLLALSCSTNDHFFQFSWMFSCQNFIYLTNLAFSGKTKSYSPASSLQLSHFTWMTIMNSNFFWKWIPKIPFCKTTASREEKKILYKLFVSWESKTKYTIEAWNCNTL